MSTTSSSDLLAELVVESSALLKRYLRGFDDANRTRQAPGLPNHVAWTMGHLALVLHRCAGKFEGTTDLPAGDFVTGDGRGGDAHRFDTESICFGSVPADDATLYPSWARCVSIFDAAIDRLAIAIRRADDARLDSMTSWGAGTITLRATAGRMVFHNGTHAGQIADLRRALGFGSIFA